MAERQHVGAGVPGEGTEFHGWVLNYSYPTDVGFDILLQSRNPVQGAWSFRAEAQKLHGSWKITTWYVVATFAPPGKTQTVVGPNDFGPGNGAAAAVGKAPLGSWVLFMPALAIALIAVAALSFAGTKWARRRRRIRAIERELASGR